MNKVFLLFVFLVLVNLPFQAASALGQRVSNFTCSAIDGKNIARNLSTGKVTTGNIKDAYVGEMKLEIDRIYWEDSPDVTETYIFRVVPGLTIGDEDSKEILIDKRPVATADVLSANDELYSLWLRRTYKDEWNGFFTTNVISDDPEQGDLQISYVHLIECKNIGVED